MKYEIIPPNANCAPISIDICIRIDGILWEPPPNVSVTAGSHVSHLHLPSQIEFRQLEVGAETKKGWKIGKLKMDNIRTLPDINMRNKALAILDGNSEKEVLFREIEPSIEFVPYSAMQNHMLDSAFYRRG